MHAEEDVEKAEESRILKSMGDAKPAGYTSFSSDDDGLHIYLENFKVEEGKPLEVYVEGKLVYSRSKPGERETIEPLPRE
jgi:hypothetical protein